jgi:hypothetical protein
MKKILLYLTLLLPVSLFAQVNDNFEDGNLDGWTQSVVGDWAASSDSPITGLYSLKHNLTDVAGMSYITHDINNITIQNGETVWRFNFKNGAWNPSTGNYFGVFLLTDQLNLSGSLNGYVIGTNFKDISNDNITLWKVSGTTYTPIIQTGYVWPNAATVGIQVTRSAIGEWTVEYDADGGFDNLVLGGTATDNTHLNAFYTGAFFEFTSTRAGQFWVDDYSITGPADTESPQIIGIDAVSSNSVLVNFNENLDETTAETLLNYSVNNSIGNPNSAILNPSNNKQVTLTFSASFVDNLLYTLTANNVEDVNGNPCSNETGTFSYFQIAAISAVPTSSTGLDVFFNKALDPTSAETEINYSVNGGIGNPSSALVEGSNNQLVHLVFSSPFQLNQPYTVTVSNVEDQFGNAIVSTGLDFMFYEVQPYDLVINEIMCDVNPAPEALPIYEYVEIYNNSDFDINLSNWTLKIGTASDKLFPAIVIPAGDYAIICKAGAESAFEPYGLPIPILVESDLTTTGKRLLIKNETGTIIEDITYSIDWYDDPEKDDGGWSMERIDPLNFCGEDENWTVTADYTGGTPGRINSVYASNPDVSAPFVKDLEYISSKQIRVHFSEKTDVLQAENENNYILNTSIHPISASISPESTSIIDLVFTSNFVIGNNTVEISGIEDNCGNVMDEYQGQFDYQLIYPGSVEVMSDNQLRLHFSEKPEALSAQTLANYFVDGSIGNPSVAIISNTDSTIVNLMFGTSFTIEQVYAMTVQNVKDINANTMNLTEIEFVYYIPKAFDVVINEIMADINPEPEGVPAARYVELYNISSYAIDLTGWVFVAEGQSERVLPYVRLYSNDYLILCESGQEGMFSAFGTVVPVLTSSDITTSGKNLKLKKPDGTVIEELEYSDEWYDDEEKDDGGWSLERIDATNFCGENDNWTASTNPLGGTPGNVNSVKNNYSDNTAPELENVHIVSSDYLILEFNENVSYPSGSDILNFNINNGIGHPELAFTDPENRTLVHLSFTTQFTAQQSYSLMIENVSDNCGNLMAATGYDFTYYRIYPKNLYVNDQNNLKLVFSETVETVSAGSILNYSCDQGVGTPDYAVRGTSDTSEVFLHFPNAFPDGSEVTLSISGIKDINGNTMNSGEFTFIYYTPLPGDLIINEVLYDPYPDGADFVELYNTSVYPIDLSRIQLAKIDENDSIVSAGRLFKDNLYIDPETYMAFTSSKTGVLQFYSSQNEENLFEVEDFPSYVNESGTVVLLYNYSVVLDSFTYDDDMHFKLLDDVEGVSLERVNPGKPTQDAANWHSASETVGFATPAYQNSQYLDESSIGDVHVSITPHVFSPDNDGLDDYATINYKFDAPGFVATVWVFDAKGRIVNQLAENLLLSTEGTIVWDGLYADNRLAAAGTYLVFFKVFDLNGNVNVYKETVILAKKR